MSVAESIVHLPSWEDGGYGYTFFILAVMWSLAFIVINLLKKSEKKNKGS
ncbi:hypothetical protein ACFO4L_01065 [Bacillus daqingensis]|uniref:Uncharacterized protein n=1 Tax=Bacillus daqingensis TaxID=872396 RepID=A0ABV9NS70_9BACI